MTDTNSPNFWEGHYRSGRTGWDLGGPTPVFRRLLESGVYPPGKMIVLCAGRGHDARMFAAQGFEVTAVDFAGEAIQEMEQLNTPEAPLTLVHTDFFHLPPEFQGRFDYLLEYTCFCAIDPQRRRDFAKLVAGLLKLGGFYIALVFPISDHTGGPPFAVSPDELSQLMREQGLQLTHREVPVDSVPGREEMEELCVFQKGHFKQEKPNG